MRARKAQKNRNSTELYTHLQGGGLFGSVGNQFAKNMLPRSNGTSKQSDTSSIWPHNILGSAVRVASPFLNTVARQGTNVLTKMPQAQAAHRIFSHAQGLLQNYVNDPQTTSTAVMSNPAMGQIVNYLGMHLPVVNDALNSFRQPDYGNPQITSGEGSFQTRGMFQPQNIEYNKQSNHSQLPSSNNNWNLQQPLQKYGRSELNMMNIVPYNRPQSEYMMNLPAQGGTRSRKHQRKISRRRKRSSKKDGKSARSKRRTKRSKYKRAS